MLAASTRSLQPMIKVSRPTPEWTGQRFDLKSFTGADLAHLRAIAVCASNPAGGYRVAIDQFEVR